MDFHSLRVRRWCATAAFAVFASQGCGHTAPPETTQPIRLEAGTDNRGANIAAAGDRVAVTWAASSGESTNIFVAMSTDGGRVFGRPVRVNDIDGDARVNGEQPPRVAVGKDVVVIWQSKKDGISRVRMARSPDDGRTFAPAITVHEAMLSGARGWASLSLDAQGNAQVAWLDGRFAVPHAASSVPAKSPAGSPPAAGHAQHGSMRQDIFHASIPVQGPAVEAHVASDVCFCCKTTVATGSNGAIYVAWRHIYPVNLRDMAVARSDDGGRTFGAPVRVSEDHWQLEGCPEDGPSIGVSDGGVVHIAWPSLVSQSADRKAICYSYSTDGGRTFAPRVQIDDTASRGSAHPQLITAGNRAVVVWEESTPDGRRIRLREIAQGANGPWAAGPPSTLNDAEPGTYPSIAVLPQAIAAAWTTNTATGSYVTVRRIDRH